MLTVVSFGLLNFLCIAESRYTADWTSLDSRPLPKWYDDAKLGISINWGIYSVPGVSNEWFWYNWQTKKDKELVDFMAKNYRPDFTYEDFAAGFKAEFFDSAQWTDILKSSGAEYVVLTSKGNDGYCLWPSKYSQGWNSMSIGSRKDLVGELGRAIKANSSMHYGVYYSLSEWYNQLFEDDKRNKFASQEFVKFKTLPQLYELVNNYSPDIIWVDSTDKALSSYWRAPEFLAWLYNESPVKDTVVTNDRWGHDTFCNHGGFATCHDQYLPNKVQQKKWENVMTIDQKSWSFRKTAELNDFLSSQSLIKTFVHTVSMGGNMLINIGPTSEGTIHPIFEERLRDIGSWLTVNGEAIKGSQPWTTQNDKLAKSVWYTQKGDAVYAIILDFKSGITISLGSPKTNHDTKVTMLGLPGKTFSWVPRLDGGLDITMPALPRNILPSRWAVTLRLTGLANDHTGSHIIG